MNHTILVSVIMCVFNTEQSWLDKAVKSILDQTHENLELLIVDDHSEKDLFTGSLYRDSRITILRNPQNLGPAASRNRALDIARGKYIAIMDSDDISYSNRLEEQVRFLEDNEDVVACGAFFRHFGEKTHEACRHIDDNEYYRCCLLFGNSPTLLNPSVMLRKGTLDAHGIRYDERLRKAEDYKMWVQLSSIGRCTNIHKVLLDYRVHASQTSQKLRTAHVSEYDWIVIKEQLDTLGLQLSEEEARMLRKDFRSSEVDAYAYYRWLCRLAEANKDCEIYDQEKLQKRVTEQWAQKIYNIKSPLALGKLIASLDGQQRRFVLKTEARRVFNKLKGTAL